jgi:hypothetical protein
LHELTVRSTEGFHHSKVGYFEINVLIEEAVLKLQVTMGDVLAMDVRYSPNKLAEELTRILGLESISHLNVVKSLSVIGQLRDNEKEFISKFYSFSGHF